ncbi:MAG: hypothetical protein ACFC1C_00855 [Candidatus Malihini olakiniferum]
MTQYSSQSANWQYCVGMGTIGCLPEADIAEVNAKHQSGLDADIWIDTETTSDIVAIFQAEAYGFCQGRSGEFALVASAREGAN